MTTTKTVKSCEMWLQIRLADGKYVPFVKTAITYEGENVVALHHLNGPPLTDEDKAWESVVRASTQAMLKLGCKAHVHYIGVDGAELPVH